MPQKNKPFKGSSKSKRKGGRVETSGNRRTAPKASGSLGTFGKGASGKLQRRHNKHLQLQRRNELLRERRVGTKNGPPIIVGILSLGEAADTAPIREFLMDKVDKSSIVTSDLTFAGSHNIQTFFLHDKKHRITLLEIPRETRTVLDICKIVDILLLVIPAVDGVDDLGRDLLSMIRIQGLPATIGLIQGLELVQGGKKQQLEIKRAFTKFFHTQIPGEPRVVESNDPQLPRWICEQKLRQIRWRNLRPYMLIDRSYFKDSSESGALNGTLCVSGYLRGERPLSANQLVHLLNCATFQVSKIFQQPDPCVSSRDPHTQSSPIIDSEEQLLDQRDNNKCEPLFTELVPDPLANEQTWPTDEEMQEEAHKTGAHFEDQFSAVEGSSLFGAPNLLQLTQKKTRKKRVPKGWSAYQASWLPSDDEESDEENLDDDDDDDTNSAKHFDDNENDLAPMNVDTDHESAQHDKEGEYEEIEVGGAEQTSDPDELELQVGDEDEMQTEEQREAERQGELKKLRESEDYAQFPDEIDTPRDKPARVRFQKYRGLKSFRTSPWDPKENLPIDYARIFQFADFAQSQKRCLLNQDGIVQPGTYISVHIENVPREFVAICQRLPAPLVLFGLLHHEHKTSVLNFFIQPNVHCSILIKSKEELIVQYGFRSFVAHPIFSQHNPGGDKHRFEKFLTTATTQTDEDGQTIVGTTSSSKWSVATMFGPITFSPAPVLMFRRKPDNPDKLELVASGSVMSVNPDRVVVKRIILTGIPFKIHKRTSIIRYMFYNPEDIAWFKPVELWTKHGLRGVIWESVGTHGYMKCRFSGSLKAHDTVCMSLYKRLFPKWDTLPVTLFSTSVNFSVPASQHQSASASEQASDEKKEAEKTNMGMDVNE